MEPILASIAAIFLTMALIPALSRVARPLGLLDQPGQRKVHSHPIPRVGGIAIAVGVLLPVLVWLPMDKTTLCLLLGGSWIALLGALDDAYDLNYMWKFLGQVPAVGLAIYGGIVMDHLPFFGLDPAPVWIAVPVTVIFFLGITNAINLFDGLDGLAGGCVLLSLAALAYLAFLVDGSAVALPALALICAVLGFLNFNTHPARVFLGDAGSQFLGFCLAALAILLIEQVHTAMNPAIPLLLLGLPILDTAWVFFLRLSQGRSPFVADRQHIHHQLLDSGFSQAKAVSTIYFFQVLFVAGAIVLRYSSDTTVVLVYLVESAAFLTFLVALKYRNRHHTPSEPLVPGALTAGLSGKLQRLAWLRAWPPRVVEISLAAFLLVGVFAGRFEQDICYLGLGVAAVMGFAAMFLASWTHLFTRIGFYTAALLVVYNYAGYYQDSVVAAWGLKVFFGLLVAVLLLGIRFADKDRFEITPQDLLIGFIALGVAAVPESLFAGQPLGFMIVVSVVLFYGCEYLVSMSRHRYALLRLATFGSLVLIGGLGILF